MVKIQDQKVILFKYLIRVYKIKVREMITYRMEEIMRGIILR